MDVALEEVRRQVSRSRYGIYCTDYEVSISEPATICFDQRCIEDFRRAAGLDQGVTLTAEIILDQYIEPWTDFHARKNADLLRRIRAAVKQAQPDADYMVYSGYQSGYTKRHYGVDWALLAPFIDIASAGYGRKPDWVDATVRALDSVPLVGGVLEYERSNHPHTLRTRVMRRLLDCRGGVMSYYGPEVDARWQRAVGEASVVAAEWGTLIREGKRADAVARPAGGVEDKDVCVIEEGTQRLIAVFNESGQPVSGRLDLVEPGGMPTVTAFPSGDRVPGQSIPLQIPPWDYRLFIMSQR